MTRRTFSVESRVQRVLNKAAAERKEKALEESVLRAISDVMAEHGRGGDQEQALRIMVRRGAEQISASVGALEASTYLAALSKQIAPPADEQAAKSAAEALFNLKQAGARR